MRNPPETYWVMLQDELPVVGSGLRRVEAVIPLTKRGKWVRVRATAGGWEWSRLAIAKWRALRPIPALKGMTLRDIVEQL